MLFKKMLLLSKRYPPQYQNLIAEYRRTITGGRLIAYRPPTVSTTPQVKGSLFSGAGTGACTGLLTTDTITSAGTAPTCSSDGVLTISAACWNIEVHRAGVLWASWKGINIDGSFEIDAAVPGGHTLYLTTTTITERTDGTGTNWANEMGFTVADGSQYFNDGSDSIDFGWRIPALVDGSGAAAWSAEYFPLSINGIALTVDSTQLYIGV